MIISAIVWVLLTVVMALIAVVETALWIVLIVATIVVLGIVVIIGITILLAAAGLYNLFFWPLRKGIEIKEKRGKMKEKLFKPLKNSNENKEKKPDEDRQA